MKLIRFLLILLAGISTLSPAFETKNDDAHGEFCFGANSPSLGEPGIELYIDNEPYDQTNSTISASYFGFNPDTVGVSFETSNLLIANYCLSEDALSVTVGTSSPVCNLVITIEDGTNKASREVVGYSTEVGFFYDESLNLAQRKYMTYKHEHHLITDEAYDTYFSYACSANSQQPSDPNVLYSQYSLPRLGSKGILTWKNDYQDIAFPLKGVRVELVHFGRLSFLNLADGAVDVDDTAYTDEWGRYEFTKPVNNSITHYIRVSAKNDLISVNYEVPGNFYRELFAFDKDAGQNETHFCFEGDNDTSKAMQILQAIFYGAKYAKEMSGRNPENVDVYFPSVLVERFAGKTSGAANQYVIPGIFLGGLAYKSWDLVLHEYGHWMQKCFGYFPEIPAEHYAAEYTVSYVPFVPLNFQLPWQEAWPSVFSLRVTRYYAKEIGSLEHVNDTFYDYYDEKYGVYNPVSLENVDGAIPLYFGDCGEGTIRAFLYDLYDLEFSESFDHISYSDSIMWYFVMDPSVKTFSDFCEKLYSTNPDMNRIGELLSHHGMTVDAIDKSDSVATESPVFSFNKCNSSGKQADTFSSDRYVVRVFDDDAADAELLVEKTITNAQSFQFTASEWNAIIHGYGMDYTMRVCSGRTNQNYPQGNYWSKPFIFHKPRNSVISPATSFSASTRLFESPINLFPSSYYQKTITFDVPGYKVFQTFGQLDTVMRVYDASGALVGEDDDDGYDRNSLIGLYCQANTPYKIKITSWDPSASDKIRLVVSSSPGFRFDYSGNIECYEDIVNLSGGSWVYSCWALQYESLMITYTPGQSGYHTISLTSVFDNYLYVIDPRSAQSMFDYGVREYDDDGGLGYNASLRKNLDKGVPYLIVFCQYNPSRSFTNLDEGDDLEIKIEVG